MDRPHAPYVLVVDDNPVILLHAAEILEDAGFSVFPAADSDAALAWLRQYGDKIVLLFTNVEIPGPMNGFGLAHFAAEHWPSMSVLVSSGKFEPLPGDIPKDAIFLPKPYTATEVIFAADRLLAAKANCFAFASNF